MDLHTAAKSLIQHTRRLDWKCKSMRTLHNYETMRRTCIGIVDRRIRKFTIKVMAAGYYDDDKLHHGYYVMQLCDPEELCIGSDPFTLEHLALIRMAGSEMPEYLMPLYEQYKSPKELAKYLIVKTDCCGNITMLDWMKSVFYTYVNFVNHLYFVDEKHLKKIVHKHGHMGCSPNHVCNAPQI